MRRRALSAFDRTATTKLRCILQSPAALTQLNDALKANPTLRVEAKYEAKLTEEGMKSFNRMLNFVSYFIGAIMAVAATFGAANSLFAIADSRRRELATLCAIGFNAWPVIASMLAESILLAFPGAFIGVALRLVLFQRLHSQPVWLQFSPCGHGPDRCTWCWLGTRA